MTVRGAFLNHTLQHKRNKLLPVNLLTDENALPMLHKRNDFV